MIDADTAGRALLDSWEHFVSGIPGAWSRRVDAGIAAVSMVPLATLNGVWTDEQDVDPGAIDELLDEVAASGMPHCLQARPAAAATLSELADRRGMTRASEIPLMVLDDAASLARAPASHPGGLAIRTLAPQEAGEHARLAALGFEAPEEHFRQILTHVALELPGVGAYVGAIGEQAVVTGLGMTLGERIGIFNIATVPGHRRRGYGAAITVHAVREGVGHGGRWAWLQSSDAGLSVYRQLGFETAESWHCWLAQ